MFLLLADLLFGASPCAWYVHGAAAAAVDEIEDAE